MPNGLHIQTDVVVLPEVLGAGGHPMSLVTVSMATGLTRQAGEPPLNPTPEPFATVLQPWLWWGGYAAAKAPGEVLFHLRRADDGVAVAAAHVTVTAGSLKSPDFVAGTDTWLDKHKAALGQIQDPNLLYQDNALNWTQGLESLARLPTPLPHAAQLAFVFLLDDRQIESDGNPVNLRDHRWIATPHAPMPAAQILEASPTPWTIDAETRQQDLAAGPGGAPTSFHCHRSPALSLLQDNGGGRLIDMTALLSRVAPLGHAVDGDQAWRADDWAARLQARLGVIGAPFDKATRVFADLAAAGVFDGPDGGKRANALLTSLAKSFGESLTPWADNPRHESLFQLLTEAVGLPANELKRLRDLAETITATPSAFLTLVRAIDPQPQSSELAVWASGKGEPAWRGVASELRRVAGRLGEAGAWAILYEHLVAAESDDLARKAMMARLKAAPTAELLHRLNTDRVLEDRHFVLGATSPANIQKGSLLTIAYGGANGAALESEGVRANAAKVIESLAAAGFSLDLSADLALLLSPAIKRLGEEFADSLVEAQVDGRDNTGAGGPPAIVITIDQAASTTADDAHDLQALLNGYGLAVRKAAAAGAPPSPWRLANLGDLAWGRAPGAPASTPLSIALESVLAPIQVSYRESGRGDALVRQPVATIGQEPLLTQDLPARAPIKPLGDDDEAIDLLHLLFQTDVAPIAAEPVPVPIADVPLEITAWWIGPCGVLPPILRGQPDDPLRPHLGADGRRGFRTDPPEGFVHRAHPKRRTPVGAPAIRLPGAALPADRGAWNKLFAPPADVMPLWEDLVPVLAADDAQPVREAFNAFLWDGKDFKAKSPPAMVFRLAPPLVSYADWRFWALRDLKRLKDNGDPDLGPVEERIRNLAAAVNLRGAMTNAEQLKTPDDPTVMVADPAVWQLRKGADKTLKRRFGRLKVRCRRLMVAPGADRRWTASLAKAGARPGDWDEAIVDLTVDGPSPGSAIGAPGDLNRWLDAEQPYGAEIVVLVDSAVTAPSLNSVDDKITIKLPAGRLYVLEFAWETQDAERFTAVARPRDDEGAAQRFLVETASQVQNLPTTADLWTALELKAVEGPPIANGLTLDFHLPTPTAPFEADPFSQIGKITAVWQTWRWDGAPPLTRPFDATVSELIQAERRNEATSAAPGPLWEAIGFEGRKKAGQSQSPTACSAVERFITLGAVGPLNPSAADYVRVRAEVTWRYQGLLPRDAQATKATERKMPDGVDISDMSDLSPWKGFAIRARPGKAPAAPKVRWAAPLMGRIRSKAGAAGFCLYLEEPAFSPKTGHGLAENYEVEVLSYQPPGWDAAYGIPEFWPMLGDDPRFETKGWAAYDLKGPERVTFVCNPLKHAVGETLEPDLVAPRIATSILMIEPDVVVHDKKDVNVPLAPWTFARVRIRRMLDEQAVFAAAAAFRESDWSAPFWIQVTQDMSAFPTSHGGEPTPIEALTILGRKIVASSDHASLALPRLLHRRWYALEGVEGFEADGRRRRTRTSGISKLGLDGALQSLKTTGAAEALTPGEQPFVQVILAEWSAELGDKVDQFETPEHLDPGLFGVSGGPLDSTLPKVRVVGLSGRIYG